jgi:ferric-dicitrate binding protein FerR (iron transport regulator)
MNTKEEAERIIEETAKAALAEDWAADFEEVPTKATHRNNQSGAAVAEIVSIIAAVSLGFGGVVSYLRSLADAAGETRAAAVEAFQQSLK